MRFLDTNVILRFLAAPRSDEDERKRKASLALFQRVATGGEVVTTCEAVLAEVMYVMCSPRQYSAQREQAAALLRGLIELRGFRLPNKSLYIRALELFVENSAFDIEDALCVAHMERLGLSEILSYDRDFDRIAGVDRVEP